MRRLLTLALLLFASTAHAQIEERIFVRDYDIDTDAYVYCVSSPQIPGNGLIETSGSSATVTAVNSTDAPFSMLEVGDQISVVVSGAESFRYVTAKASAISITVNSAVDWSAGSGLGFTWRDVTCGTTVNDGWVPVGTYDNKTITVEYNQGDLTGGLDVRFECRGSSPGALPVIVYPDADGTASCGGGTFDSPDCNFATASIGITNRLTLVIYEPFSQCRMAMKIGTSDGDDVGTNAEQITAYLVGQKSAR